MEHKIVIADCDHDNIDIELDVLKSRGLPPCDWRRCITEQEVIDGCGDAEVLIIQYAKISRKVMEKLSNLKQVVRYGVGVDTVDLKAAKEHGITVCNVPDYGMNEVADQAMAHTLNLLRKVYLTNEHIREGVWDFNKIVPIHRFSEQTVGIIGLGRIGKQYAKRLHSFGFNIIATDDKVKDVPEYVTMVAYEDLLRRSDVISVHCPADDNIDLIGEREFGLMKDGVYLINVSRGGIVNEQALDRALTSGKIAGAGIDVVAQEPMARDDCLLRHKNLSISPHMAWYSEESAKELKRKVAEEAARFVKGEAVHYSLV